MATADLPTGVKIYYESHGEGQPLVFIPATGFSGEVWKSHQIPELSKSMRVIVFDPRGCGRSSRVTGVCTIDQMACDVAALLDHLQLLEHILDEEVDPEDGLGTEGWRHYAEAASEQWER